MDGLEVLIKALADRKIRISTVDILEVGHFASNKHVPNVSRSASAFNQDIGSWNTVASD